MLTLAYRQPLLQALSRLQIIGSGALFRKADAELDRIDKQINERKEIARRLVGTQDDAICQICQKTKFADGIGHKCFYCQLRSCARCGGRSQSKNKAIWACSLCQKRQQILAKTGKWFQPDEVQHKLSNAGHDSPCQSMSPIPFPPQPQQPQDVFGVLQSLHPDKVDKSSEGSKSTLPPQQLPTLKQSIMDSAACTSKQAQKPSANGPSLMKTEDPHDKVRRQNTLQRQPSLAEEQSRQHGNGALSQQQFTTTLRDVNRVETLTQQRPSVLKKQDECGNVEQGYDKNMSPSCRASEEKRGNRPLFYTESDGRFDEAARNDLQDDSELQNSTAKDQRRCEVDPYSVALY
ncbi:hypothetical protein RB195_024522 [Necator americanus]|uniref:FYVE-type domain-containing protein n=1 Tax=Necator americanus TaxID=51031 RepID=A0ABR1EQR8_NECAM